MSDDHRNEGWGHRSEMQGPSDPQCRSVTANVNERRAGTTMDRQEVRAMLDDGPEQDADDEGDGDESSEDWEDRFEAQHLPGE